MPLAISNVKKHDVGLRVNLNHICITIYFVGKILSSNVSEAKIKMMAGKLFLVQLSDELI